MTEAELQARVMRGIGSRPDTRVFRNQVGVYRLEDGRVIASGLCKGSGDLVGWQTIEVTPSMVGRRIAVFISLEIKTSKGRVSPEQINWANAVRKAGGRAGVARSLEEAQQILTQPFPSFEN
jgi:hypothetical protein